LILPVASRDAALDDVFDHRHGFLQNERGLRAEPVGLLRRGGGHEDLEFELRAVRPDGRDHPGEEVHGIGREARTGLHGARCRADSQGAEEGNGILPPAEQDHGDLLDIGVLDVVAHQERLDGSFRDPDRTRPPDHPDTCRQCVANRPADLGCLPRVDLLLEADEDGLEIRLLTESEDDRWFGTLEQCRIHHQYLEHV